MTINLKPTVIFRCYLIIYEQVNKKDKNFIQNFDKRLYSLNSAFNASYFNAEINNEDENIATLCLFTHPELAGFDDPSEFIHGSSMYVNMGGN